MTERKRFLQVLKGQTPDRVPWFADLGHWYRAEMGTMWNLFTISNCTKEIADLHREVKAGWYVEVGSLFDEYYEGGVSRIRELNGDVAVERYVTPIGEVRMERKWSPYSFSWDIIKLMVQTPKDLEILTYAIEQRRFKQKLENWETMESIGSDTGLGFPHLGYSGLGSLMSYYMGVQNTIYAIYDEPELIKRYIDIYNSKQLEIVDINCASKAPHFIFGDNLSSDVQPPDLFTRYSFEQYKQIANRLHKAGKTVSAHLDGMLGNIIGLVAKTGVDVADACTPAPTGDLTPEQIRHQAGNDMVIFGGISPSKWLPETSERDFIEHVRQWLDLRKISPRIVQSAGDQVPPGTKLQRIKLVHDLVEEYGRYDDHGS